MIGLGSDKKKKMFFLVGKYCTLIEDFLTPITVANCTFHHTFILSKAAELAPNDFAKASCSFFIFPIKVTGVFFV